MQTQDSAQTVQQAPAYSTLYVVNCRESISLRTSPDTSSYAMRQIPLGAAVSYMENASNGFYKISYMGDVGYSLASYLSTNPNNSHIPPTTAPRSQYRSSYDAGDWLEVVNCKVSTTLRAYPSTSASEILQIPLGDWVEFLSTAENGFYYVDYEGYRGYALASYFR